MTSNPSAAVTKNGEWVIVFKQVAKGEPPKGGRVSIGLARASGERHPVVRREADAEPRAALVERLSPHAPATTHGSSAAAAAESACRGAGYYSFGYYSFGYSSFGY